MCYLATERAWTSTCSRPLSKVWHGAAMPHCGPARVSTGWKPAPHEKVRFVNGLVVIDAQEARRVD